MSPHVKGQGGDRPIMKPIRLSETERKKPLSYDISTQKFLYLTDIQAGRIFPPQQLDEESKRVLTLKRLEMEEAFSIESLGAMDKEQQMEEVRKGTEKGKEIVRAEIAYLVETIKEIEKGKIV
jgi:hypothetical protein